MKLKAGIRAGVALALAFGALATAAERVEISAPNGSALRGSLWLNDSPSPRILLLPQCDRDWSALDALGSRLGDAGFTVLAIDYGAGSAGEGKGAVPSATATTTNQPPGDQLLESAEAAYQYLEQLGTTQAPAVGAVGVGCGGEVLVSLAEAHPELRLLVFLSVPLTPEKERDVLQLQSRSLLMVTAKGDREANHPAATIAYRKRNATRLFLYEGATRGAELLEENPELTDRIVGWFESES